jgi:hypothetical protein
MVGGVVLQVEVVGCPTVCRHCWAQGTPYRAMPVGDVALALERVHRCCDRRRLGFAAYPMHEVAAHPRAVEVLELFAGHVGAAEFEPLSTTGVPLATRQDWAEVLAAAARLGTTTIWVAFHGIGVEHDRMVNRSGAYAETCLAIERAHAVGLRAGGNVFVTKANAPQADRLLGVLGRLGVEEMSWEPAAFHPTPRGRRNERLRPEPPDLLPFADRILQLSPFHRHAWADLEAHTEAAWVGRALAGDWPAEQRHTGELLELVCRPSLDLHLGTAGRHGERLGNLRADDPQVMLARALDRDGRPPDAPWSGPGPAPVAELAVHGGDRAGRGVHFSADSVGRLWLDRARAPRGGAG